MECFRPKPNDLRVRAVTKPYESVKTLYVSIEGGTILLRGKKGLVLERIPLSAVRWLPCSLPGGVDHCISFQYKEPQPTEIFLKAKTRAAVAQILTNLDAAATKLSPNALAIHAVARAPTNDMINLDDTIEEPSPIDITEQHEESEHSPSRCPRCWQLAQLLDEHEAQSQDFEVLRAELEACRADLEAAWKERDAAKREISDAVAAARKAAYERQKELENCLAEAAERCEKLLQELHIAADAADKNATRCQELQAELEKAEEEKKFLVDALTTAQAQLHDAQKAFKETASQLQGASKSCSAAREQAAAAQSELALVKQDAAKQASVAQQVHEELEKLQNALHYAEREAAQKEAAWAEERIRLENALAAAMSAKMPAYSGPAASEASDRASAEVVVLRAHVEELKDKLCAAKTAAAGQMHNERASAAEAAALRAQEELLTTKKSLEEHYNAMKDEVKNLRAQMAAAQVEAANSKAALDAERGVANNTAAELHMLQQQLTAALAAQSSSVKDRHGLEASLDRSNVEIDRLRRRNEALEARCRELGAVKDGQKGSGR